MDRENPSAERQSWFVVFIHALTGGFGWLAKLPTSTWDGIEKRIGKAWAWIKGLPTMKAAARRQVLEGIGTLFKDVASSVATALNSVGTLLIQQKQAEEVERSGQSKAKIEEAKANIFNAKAEHMRKSDAVQQQFVDAILAGTMAGSVTIKNGQLEVFAETKVKPTRTIVPKPSNGEHEPNDIRLGA